MPDPLWIRMILGSGWFVEGLDLRAGYLGSFEAFLVASGGFWPHRV